jgi:hypothetical protein
VPGARLVRDGLAEDAGAGLRRSFRLREIAAAVVVRQR